MTRRRLLESLAAVPLAAHAGTDGRFRLAICSETYSGQSFKASSRLARESGYTGVEVAPFHLSDDPAALARSQRQEFARIMSDAGVSFVGTHALLSAPPGLHITTSDHAVRQRSWDYFKRLIDLTADLGDGSVMVLGSSEQRAAADANLRQVAMQRLEAGLAEAARHASARNVTILIEPLAPHLCNVVNTLAEAIAIVKRIGSPAVQTMFDTHNTTAETEPHDKLIEKYLPYIRHVHLNELDGRYPGSGKYEFLPVLRALREHNYDRWLSVEVFDFKPDGKTVAAEASRFIRQLETTI